MSPGRADLSWQMSCQMHAILCSWHENRGFRKNAAVTAVVTAVATAVATAELLQ